VEKEKNKMQETNQEIYKYIWGFYTNMIVPAISSQIDETWKLDKKVKVLFGISIGINIITLLSVLLT